MADVAKAAGVTKAALYYHFADKVDLYTTVALQRITSIHEAMNEAAAGGGTLEERLLRLAIVGFERLRAGRLRAASPRARAPRRRPPPAAAQGDGRPAGARSSAASRRPARPIRGCRPRAATELLGGILFSLIFANPGAAAESPLPKDRVERAKLAIRLFLGGYWSLARGEDQQA